MTQVWEGVSPAKGHHFEGKHTRNAGFITKSTKIKIWGVVFLGKKAPAGTPTPEMVLLIVKSSKSKFWGVIFGGKKAPAGMPTPEMVLLEVGKVRVTRVTHQNGHVNSPTVMLAQNGDTLGVIGKR